MIRMLGMIVDPAGLPVLLCGRLMGGWGRAFVNRRAGSAGAGISKTDSVRSMIMLWFTLHLPRNPRLLP
jgi:hypothetical protein